MREPPIGTLVEILDRLDRGMEPPILSGEPGRFFRSYTSQSQDALRIALASNVEIGRDGAIWGTNLERARLEPLDFERTFRDRETSHGRVWEFPSLCPELLTVVVCRLYGKAAAAQEALRKVVGQGGAEAYGAFRWLPPGTLTAGRASFESLEKLEGWGRAPYLLRLADAVQSPVHPLNARLFSFEGRVVFREIFSMLGVLTAKGTIRVPRGLTGSSLEIEFDTIFRQLDPGALVRLLVSRSPFEMVLHLWEWNSVDTDQACELLAFHIDYLNAINPDLALDRVAFLQELLEDLDLKDPDLPKRQDTQWRIPSTPFAALAARLACGMRFGLWSQ